MSKSPSKNSSCSSDDEFWAQLNSQTASTSSPRNTKINLRSKAKPRQNSSYQDAQKIDEIDRFRQAKQVEIDNVRRIIQQQANRRIEASTESMKKWYQDQIESLNDQVDEMRSLLYCKDLEIKQLQKMIIDKSVVLDTNLIQSNRSQVTLTRRQTRMESMLIQCKNCEENQQKNIGLTKELNSLLKTVELYKNTDREQKYEIEKQIAAQSNMKREYKEEIENLNMKIFESYETKDTEIQKINAGMKVDNERKNKELEIMKVLNSRKSETIDVLKSDLQKATSILKNPRLKHKMLLKQFPLENIAKSTCPSSTLFSKQQSPVDNYNSFELRNYSRRDSTKHGRRASTRHRRHQSQTATPTPTSFISSLNIQGDTRWISQMRRLNIPDEVKTPYFSFELTKTMPK